MTKIKDIVILTGAGISAESGIQTFRDNDGLWEDHPVEQVATPAAFARDPQLVQRFYNMRRTALVKVQPNAAHQALARLQKDLSRRGGQVTIVTQNVDDLHERGGAHSVIHMHGELTSILCTACRARWRSWADLSTDSVCPHCERHGTPRPDIVWFGEMPYQLNVIETLLFNTELFVSIGTSGAVYPAAGFVELARHFGKRTLEINLERSAGSHHFHETRVGKAGTLVPQWVDEILT